MSQNELAEKLNIAQSTISEIECGKYNENFGFIHIINIAEALDIDLSLLLRFTGYEKEMWSKRIGR